MSDETDKQEISLSKVRAIVILTAGITVSFTPPLVVLLTFIDCFSRHVPWTPDERILLAMLGAFASIAAFAFTAKKQ